MTTMLLGILHDAVQAYLLWCSLTADWAALRLYSPYVVRYSMVRCGLLMPLACAPGPAFGLKLAVLYTDLVQRDKSLRITVTSPTAPTWAVCKVEYVTRIYYVRQQICRNGR